MNSTTTSGQGQGQGTQPTSDILFLKRLLFLKASLDNETTLSNQSAIRLDGDKIFDADYDRQRMMSAPGTDRRTRAATSNRTMEYDDEQSLVPLAITSKEDESHLMLMPGQQLHSAREVNSRKPHTAGRSYRIKPPTNMRASQQMAKQNSLNLNAMKYNKRTSDIEVTNKTLLNKLEKSKYITQKDLE